jgi:hypothetical protein
LATDPFNDNNKHQIFTLNDWKAVKQEPYPAQMAWQHPMAKMPMPMLEMEHQKPPLELHLELQL